MENVGCVTYRDQYICKDPPSDIQLLRICDTFLHEMAHMWFGNLVTMKWWDDLWLNESFATFMSSLAIDFQLHSAFPQVWLEFLGSKGWGYATDQLSTTHPISTPVKTTTETETNFDGISYSKGSAVLKQLYFLVGHKVFKIAMGRYMKRFQYSNAEFADLIKFIGAAAFEAHNPLDINTWASSWILTSGLNELSPEITYEEGKIVKLVVHQKASLEAHPTLRNHTIIIEAFDSDLQSLGKHTVLIKDQPETVLDVFNGIQASAVILNVDDWGYCKIRIDDKSLSVLKANLIKIKEPLTRQLVYRALWDMVRDIKISAVEFIEFVIQHFPLETDNGIANYSLEISNAALYNYIPKCPAKENLAHDLFNVILTKIQGGISQDTSLIYQKILKAFIYHPDDVKLALSWVENNNTNIPGFVLGKLDRWAIIKKYAKITELAKTYVEKEYLSDPSDTGHLAKLYCEAAYPIPEEKEKLWNKLLTTGDTYSRYEREHVMQGFNAERQGDILEGYGEKYFNNVLKVINEKDKEYYIDFATHLIPSYLEDDWVIEKLEATIGLLPADKFEIEREFRETVDALKRCKKGKDLSRDYLNSLSN